MTAMRSLPLTLIAAAVLFSCARAQAAEPPATTGDDEEAPDGLSAIIAAQQAVEHIQGQLVYRTVHADEPEAEPQVQHVAFAVTLPDRYFLSWTSVDDPEARDMYISDGETQWNVEIWFEGADPLVDAAPVDRGGWGFHRVADFFALDREALGEDFAFALVELPAETAIGDATQAVTLTPIAPELAEEIASITVHLDDSARTTGVVIVDAENNVSTIEVAEVDYETAPDPALYTWSEAEE